MRQRLSSEPDRYRGRRRVPTPPRGRYAAVVTSAFVGAGIVAIGAATNVPDAKAINPSVLADLQNASTTAKDLANRTDDAHRATRDNDRTTEAKAKAKANHPRTAAEMYRLPMDNYTLTSPYGLRYDNIMHNGVDLAAPEGTPYKAVHGGVVKSAGYDGGYGYAVTVMQADGVETIYAHSRRVYVQAGQTVNAGDVIGEVGNTGHSYGAHLHLEMHARGKTIDPSGLLLRNGVDLKLQIESVYSDLAAS